jgi:flagellar basal body-associated protein FliL
MAKSTTFQKILIYILIALAVSIVSLTIILAVSGSIDKARTNGMPVPTEDPQLGIDDYAVFDGIGTLRLSTCDEEPVPIVLSVYFYYPTDDSLYYEELSTKTRSLKAIVTNYFAGQTKEQLQKRGESTVKAQLKNLLNKELVLGKIDALYFGEYLFFD